MGHSPPPPRPENAAHFLRLHERRLLREIEHGRCSRFGWRRRRSYSACVTLIKAREALLGKIPDPWVIVAPPKPRSPRDWIAVESELR